MYMYSSSALHSSRRTEYLRRTCSPRNGVAIMRYFALTLCVLHVLLASGRQRCMPKGPGSLRWMHAHCTGVRESTSHDSVCADKCDFHAHQQLFCPRGRAQMRGASGDAFCSYCYFGQYGILVAAPGSDGLASVGRCIQCPRGKYSTSAGQTFCTTCPTGKHSTAQRDSCASNSIPSYCPAGQMWVLTNVTQYSVRESGKCMPCTHGRYQPSAGEKSCRACPAGKFAPKQNSTSCAPCPAAKYQSLPRSTKCRGCNRGGQYQARKGQQTCNACPAGKFVSSHEQKSNSACNSCPIGKFQASPAAALCEMCPPGKAQAKMASPMCVTCGPGSQANYQASQCLQCAPGFFRPDLPHEAHARMGCQLCIPGHYQPEQGKAFCIRCSGRKRFRDADATGCSLKPQCPRGYFFAGPTHCAKCPAGKYATLPNRYLCLLCRSGTAQPKRGQRLCIRCKKGERTPPGSTSCTQKAFKNVYRGLKCPAGKFPAQDKACHKCPAGKFSMYARATCTKCKPGQFSHRRAAFCRTCTRGRTAKSEGAVACEPCPMGKFAKTALACSTCAPGLSSIPGGTGCLPTLRMCPRGRYPATPFVCEDCPSGQSKSSSTLHNCTKCSPGWHQPLSGQDKCKSCIPGQYQQRSGTLECLPCPHGKYQGELTARHCFVCPAGKFSTSANETLCHECVAGRYCSQEGCLKCTICGIGRVSSMGATQCKKCPRGRGFHLPTKCTNCTLGRFSSSNGRCQDCPPGRYQSSSQGINCQSCEPGRSARLKRSARCMDCPRSKFQTKHGQITCIMCASCPVLMEGFFRAGCGGSSEGICKICPLGKFMPSPILLSCSLCPRGRYRGKVSDRPTRCHECPAGQQAFADRRKCSFTGKLQFSQNVTADQEWRALAILEAHEQAVDNRTHVSHIGRRDCKLSQWSDWFGCGAKGGVQRFRARHIEIAAQGGGKPCSKFVRQLRSCPKQAGETSTSRLLHFLAKSMGAKFPTTVPTPIPTPPPTILKWNFAPVPSDAEEERRKRERAKGSEWSKGSLAMLHSNTLAAAERLVHSAKHHAVVARDASRRAESIAKQGRIAAHKRSMPGIASVMEIESMYFREGAAPYLKPEVVANISMCQLLCQDLARCNFGTFFTYGQFRGQCWLSEGTCKTCRVPCGTPCISFKKRFVPEKQVGSQHNAGTRFNIPQGAGEPVALLAPWDATSGAG